MENNGITTTELYKQRILNLFKNFINFCEEKSLDYFCTGGTMLGAVRHQGLIPWDDDIDLFMMRSDYDKLISFQQELRSRGIGLEGIQCNDRFGVFLKIWDINTTLWEIEEIPFVYGVFIDIFPLDYSNDTISEFHKKYKKRRRLFLLYQCSQMRFSFKSLKRRLEQRDYKFLAKEVFSLFVPLFMKKMIRKAILKEDEKNKKSKGNFLASYYGDYWDRELFPKSWFEGYVMMDFEKLKVKIPVGYDGYLTQIYHDYLKLPPIEKRKTHHYHYYVDLNQHYNINQIKLKMQQK